MDERTWSKWSWSSHCKVEHQAVCFQGSVFELRVVRPQHGIPPDSKIHSLVSFWLELCTFIYRVLHILLFFWLKLRWRNFSVEAKFWEKLRKSPLVAANLIGRTLYLCFRLCLVSVFIEILYIYVVNIYTSLQSLRNTNIDRVPYFFDLVLALDSGNHRTCRGKLSQQPPVAFSALSVDSASSSSTSRLHVLFTVRTFFVLYFYFIFQPSWNIPSTKWNSISCNFYSPSFHSCPRF